MCTVSWIYQDAGYHLFCNRDEKHTRRPASKPQLLTREGVRVLAPIDGDFGGSWIAVNEFGLSLALLNRGPGSPAQLSRGLLVMNLIAAPTLAEAAQRFAATDLSDFAPFTLLGLSLGLPAAMLRWDRQESDVVTDADSHMPLVSSSVDPAGCETQRRSTLEQIRAKSLALHPGALLAFHRSHSPAPGAQSVCMHRDDAQTVSFTWVTVDGVGANMYYAAGSPCRSMAGESLSLTLCGCPQTQCA
jgi:hypothetical protein